ncbi:MAG: uroporphyrinogen-III synthase [Pseudomonadota bacterium]
MNTAENTPVIVTRPAHQAQHFIEGLQQQGLPVVALPTISIQYRSAPLTSDELLLLHQNDLLIFTSANAASAAVRLDVLQNTDARTACIGVATARALRQHNIEPDYVPPGNLTSEGLLEFLQQNTTGSTITLVQGHGGRELLLRELTAQGKSVTPLALYSRELPVPDAESLAQAIDALPCTISVSSNEGLTNLLKIIPQSHHRDVLRSDLIVNSERCRDLADSLGHRGRVAIASPPGDKGQLAALARLQQR